MTGSKVAKESRANSLPVASSAWLTNESGIITQNRRSSNPEAPLISGRTHDRRVQGIATQPSTTPHTQDRSDLEKKPSLSSVPIESLADQYLDTMVMDDVWRAACINKIRQNQRILALRPASKKPSKSHHLVAAAKKPVDPLCKVSKKAFKPHARYAVHPPTPPVSPRTAYRSEHSSSPSSDSGFISSSPTPTPSPSRLLRMRSTRSWPMNNSSASTLIDIPASMVGRSCLSCGCTNTTCWRRTLGGIICNSCGLRLSNLLGCLMEDTKNAVLFVQISSVVTSLLEARFVN
jgi:hypothetical protein